MSLAKSFEKSILQKLNSIENDDLSEASFISDVSNLINTKLKFNVEDNFSEVKNSILTYGLPNFSEYKGNSVEISQQICDDIQYLLERHEPRLYKITVKILNINKYSLDFSIDAVIHNESSEPFKIHFNTNYKPSLQQFDVKPPLE